MPTSPQQPAQKSTVKSIADSELGRIYIRLYCKNTLFARGQWYRYATGVWSTIPDFEIDVEVWKLLEAHESAPHFIKPKKTMHSSVLAYIRAYLSISEDKLDAYPNLINLRNGIYNLDTNQLIPHDSTLLLTSQLPFEYDPAAIAPMWTAYVLTTFVDKTGQVPDPELVSFMQEIIGYSLTTDISHQIMFWCIGEGENGKGVLFHVLTQLGGTSAIYLDLNILRREKYQLANLVGKRIALCSEANTRDNLVEDGPIKALVHGDPYPVRQIRREPFTLYPQTKFWWSMNRMPVVVDTSHGFWRSMRPIPFNKIFSDSDRIIDLKEKLNKELSGIFNWALIGLYRIRQNGKFSPCRQIDTLRGELQTESNTILLFLNDEMECTWMTPGNYPAHIVDSFEESSKTVYARYVEWAKSNGYKPMSDRSLKVEMEGLKCYYKAGTNKRVYTRIKLRTVSIFNP